MDSIDNKTYVSMEIEKCDKMLALLFDAKKCLDKSLKIAKKLNCDLVISATQAQLNAAIDEMLKRRLGYRIALDWKMEEATNKINLEINV